MKKFLVYLLVTIFVLSGFVSANASSPAVKTGNSIVTISGTANSAGSEYVTVMLVKSTAEKITPEDLGYIRQYKLNTDGSYNIDFPFDGFEFDSTGNVSNYKLCVNIAGEFVTPDVHKVTGTDALSSKVYVSRGNTAASVMAELDNMLGDTATDCTMIIAAYSGDGVLLGAEYANETVAAGKNERKYLDMQMPEGTTYVKGFLWNSIPGIIPLYTSKTEERIFGGYDFESETESVDWYWSGVSNDGAKTVVEVTDEAGYESNRSISILSQCSWGAVISKHILLPLLEKGNGMYKVTADVMPSQRDAIITASLSTRSADGNFINTNATMAPTLKAGQWNKLSQTIQVNLDGNESYAILRLTNSSGYGQKIYIDNIKLEPIGQLTAIDNADTVNVYMVGDSLCTNYTVDEANNTVQGWGYYLDKRIGGGAVAVNNATGGHDTNEYLYGKENWDGAPPERWSTIYSLADDNDYVMIALGTNDYWQPISQEDYLSNIGRMVSDIKAKGATPILVISTPMIHEEYWGVDDKVLRNDNFSNYFNSLKTIDDVAILDLRSEFMDFIDSVGREYAASTVYVSDETHLTHIGAKKASDILVELIKAEPKLKTLAEYIN